jgi:general stress protein 26
MKKSANIKKVAKLMRELDFCMFTTHRGTGALNSRPMSNNGEVEFDGDVWFFTAKGSRKVREIQADPRVQLTYIDPKRFLFISMYGRAKIVSDIDKKRELWMPELDQWFEEGPEDENVVLLKVTPRRVAFWGKDGDDEISLT